MNLTIKLCRESNFSSAMVGERLRDDMELTGLPNSLPASVVSSENSATTSAFVFDSDSVKSEISSSIIKDLADWDLERIFGVLSADYSS